MTDSHPAPANAQGAQGGALGGVVPPSIGRPWLAALFFLVATVFMTWPLAVAPGDQYTGRQDFYLNLWILDWVAQAVTTPGLEIFHSDAIFFPRGVGLETQPLSLVQTIPAIPLTLAFGPMVTFNLLALFGFWFAGWVASLWVTSLTGDQVAGLLGGSLFTFSVYHYTYLPQMGMAMIGFLPLFMLADLAFTRRPTMGKAILSGMALAVVGMGAWYYGIIAGITAAALSARRVIGALREKQPGHLRCEAVFWIACLATMAPVVLRMLPAYTGESNPSGETEYAGMGIVMEHLKATQATMGIWSFAGIVGLVFACLGCRPFRARWGLVVMALGYFALSAGSTLSLGDIELGMPYAWLQHLPVVSTVRYPDRFFILAQLALAALAGFGLARLRVRWNLKPAVLGLILVLPLAEVWPGPLPSVPTTGSIPIPAPSPGDEGAVVTVPTTYRNLDGEVLYHQTHHGRAVAGGYVTRRDRQLTKNITKSETLGVFAERRPVTLPKKLPKKLAESGVSWVYVQRSQWVDGAPTDPLSIKGPFALGGATYLRQRYFPRYKASRVLADDAPLWEAALDESLGEPVASGPRFVLYKVTAP